MGELASAYHRKIAKDRADEEGIVANPKGDVEASYTYDPFGEAKLTEGSVDTGNPYTYNGEYTDETTTNQYLRARYYDPQTGSFLSEDSYAGDPMEPLSQNRYTYAENNP